MFELINLTMRDAQYELTHLFWFNQATTEDIYSLPVKNISMYSEDYDNAGQFTACVVQYTNRKEH